MDNTKIAEDYIPFGPEWEKETLKMTKPRLIKFLAKVCIERNELKDKLAATHTTQDGDKEGQLMKYLLDSIKESEAIYGPIKRVSQYGGSIFAIYESGKCYRLNWQSYNQDIVTLD